MSYIGSSALEEEWLALEKERMEAADAGRATALADRQAELEGKLVALAELAGANGVARDVRGGNNYQAGATDKFGDIRIAIMRTRVRKIRGSPAFLFSRQ